MWFDYEEAERDIRDAGGDPDYLDYRNSENRDKYLKDLGLRPSDYGGSNSSSSSSWWSSSSSSNSSDSFWSSGSDSGSSDDSCFLTTACTKARGLPDDCFELQTLRRYRDSDMKSFEEGRQAVEYYYEVAPKIVAAVDAREDAAAIWAQVYDEMIVPCVALIENGGFDDAYRLYRNGTTELERKYLK